MTTSSSRPASDPFVTTVMERAHIEGVADAQAVIAAVGEGLARSVPERGG